MIKKLAIVGANGYLGQNTVRKAIRKGWEVVGIVRREDAAKEVEILGAKSFIIKDFNLDALREAFEGCVAVIHFANVVCGSKEIFEKVNIEGTQAIINAARESSVSRIIYPSGLGVDKYGIEDWANNEYFKTKMIAERILQEGNVPFVIFRPSYILGPNDELIPEIIDKIIDGTVYVVGEGKVPMQPIFVEDAIEAFLAAAQGKGEDNKIYDLVGSKVINMVTLIDLIYNTMKEIGFNVPPPQIVNITYNEAPQKLNTCKEMVDVMKCNIIRNGNITAEALNFKLSPIESAIKAAIEEKLRIGKVNNNKKAIVLLSGGMDSATALFWAFKEGFDIISLSFDYGWRARLEKKAASELAKKVNSKFIEVPIPFVKQATDLRIEKFPVPCAINAPEGFIPLRNLVFYSIAAYYAKIYGCNFVIGGHTAEDPISFPDASPLFFNKLEKLIGMSNHSKDKENIKFLFPLSKLNKSEILKLAKELKVPLELTWSCYFDNDMPCEKCSSCQKREKAFKELGILDPAIKGLNNKQEKG